MRVTIHEPNQAQLAAEWCQENHIPFKIEFWGWPGSKIYKFVFQKDKDAMIFSLKWAK